jgi:predicted amidohydrolase
MSEAEHASIVADTLRLAASQGAGAELAGEGALSFDAALDRAAADIARGLFPPVVVSLVSLLALGFALFTVALYFAS